MPHLLIRGVAPDGIREVSQALVAELAVICQCPEDYIVLECLTTTAVYEGQFVASYPFVEVNWFERGPRVRDLAAECIDRHIRSLGIPEAEIAFRRYESDGYYANGRKLSETEGEANKEALQALQSENQRLKEELLKARKALQTGSGPSMSSKLYDALRE
ncbi:DUF1904 family protein [Cohnella endophytica]|uniref:DUF1904 family protein n=1 Tax=Cohnella endophytica TaxID=2419778 RepID=A0A494X7J8_9BACL|nr:DUF1904 family protein [Cohnella endophytica]RKP44286.1 DUF1904 family protein [Cohnella endophytica]